MGAHSHRSAGRPKAAAGAAVAYQHRNPAQAVEAPAVVRPGQGPAFLPAAGVDRPTESQSQRGTGRLQHDMGLAGPSAGEPSKPESATVATKQYRAMRKKKSISGDL